MSRPVSAYTHPEKFLVVSAYRSAKGLGKQLFPCMVLLLLLGGCTNADVARFLSTPITSAPNTDSTTNQSNLGTIDPALASSNRLLVEGDDGNLFTIDPTGAARFDLTTDASRSRSYTQATWSSSGERIGWTLVEQSGGTLESALLTSRADGSERTQVETRFAPFYLFWSPDDSKLAYLSNWIDEKGPTIALQIADIAEPTTAAALVGTGQPFYFSWSPTGEQMLTHVANQSVALLTLADGESKILTEVAANFAAPQWSAAGNQLLFVMNEESSSQLVVTDASGVNEQLVTTLGRNDSISFGLNSTGTQLAYIETSQAIGFNAFGPLFLYDLAQEEFTQLSDGPVLAFFWSPDGQSLFFLSAEPDPDRPLLRVNVWNGEDVQSYARFVPNATFLSNYLRFADQYMQSMRFWSPDSQSIVYVGEGENGKQGVWVQSVQGNEAAQLVAAGNFATWSPR
jgi:TolB protein